MVALCSTSVPVLAKGGGAGGASTGHISSQGITNSNGSDSADRDKGRARAADRAREHGKSQTRMHSGKSK
nr:hypothetical protein [Ralstonia sp. UBA689]